MALLKTLAACRGAVVALTFWFALPSAADAGNWASSCPYKDFYSQGIRVCAAIELSLDDAFAWRAGATEFLIGQAKFGDQVFPAAARVIGKTAEIFQVAADASIYPQAIGVDFKDGELQVTIDQNPGAAGERYLTEKTLLPTEFALGRPSGDFINASFEVNAPRGPQRLSLSLNQSPRPGSLADALGRVEDVYRRFGFFSPVKGTLFDDSGLRKQAIATLAQTATGEYKITLRGRIHNNARHCDTHATAFDAEVFVGADGANPRFGKVEARPCSP